MSEARNNTIPHIIITGGAEQLPKNPPIGGGIYRAEPAFPRESYAGWGGVQVAYVPGQFVSYNSVTALGKETDGNIATARKNRSVDPAISINSANDSINASSAVSSDPRIVTSVLEVKKALEEFNQAESQRVAAEKKLGTISKATAISIKKGIKECGLTKVHPNDYDAVLRMLQRVTNKAWERDVTGPIIKEINAKQRLLSQINKSNAAQETLNVKSGELRKVTVKATEDNDVKEAIKVSSEFLKEVTGKYGENASKISQELEDAAKGKKLKNATEALEAWNKHQGDIDKKYSKADRAAVTKALESVSYSDVAKQMNKFSKVFGFIGNVNDATDLLLELNKSNKTGDWKPFFVKAETIVASRVAGVMVAFAFGLVAATPIGLIGFAVIMGVTSALIDEELINKFNSMF
ncbi:colicin-like pore-forming protein [Erwinia rhapontici]|uniref:colicin-like pore-forming protein n=1 Tax=Erwinia TaxID=551 RepID=UPI001D0DBD1B|nr:colicin-like pore-forming protein [Erwinia rhapontici]UDQ81187.1 colicin-like pore-forming protein [Erwinia rhapontici]